MADNTREINTSFGKYQISTFANTATLHGSRDPEVDQKLIINGIACSGSINLVYERYRDWHTKDANGDGIIVTGWHANNSPMFMRRYDKNQFGSDITDGMRQKIYDVIVPEAVAYLDSHPDIVREGWLAYYEHKEERALSIAKETYNRYLEAVREATKASLELSDFVYERMSLPMPDDMCVCSHIRQYHDEKWCTQYQSSPNDYKRCDCSGFVKVEVTNAETTV